MAGDQLGKPEGQQIESVLVFAKGKDYKPAVRTKAVQVEKVNYFKSFMKLFKK